MFEARLDFGILIGERKVLEGPPDQIDTILQAGGSVEALLHLYAQGRFQGQIEEQEFTHFPPPVQGLLDPAARLEDLLCQACRGEALILPVSEEEKEQVVERPVQEPPGCVHRRLEVAAAVYGLERPQEVLEVVYQPIPDVGHEIRGASDRALIALEPLPGDTPFPERPVEEIEISVALQERDVALADHDVIRCRVVVQLLVPLLEEVPGDLLYVVAVHDLEDLIPDPLALSPASHAREHQPDEATPGRLARVSLGELPRKAVQGVGKLFGFRVVVALPVELPDRRVPEPDEKEGQPVHLSPHPVQQVVAEIEPVHQGPGVGARFGGEDRVGKGCDSRVAQCVLPVQGIVDRNVEVLPMVLQPPPCVARLQDKADAQGEVVGRQVKLQAGEPVFAQGEGCLHGQIVEHDRTPRSHRRRRQGPRTAPLPGHSPVEEQGTGKVRDQHQPVTVSALAHGYGQGASGVEVVAVLVKDLLIRGGFHQGLCRRRSRRTRLVHIDSFFCAFLAGHAKLFPNVHSNGIPTCPTEFHAEYTKYLKRQFLFGRINSNIFASPTLEPFQRTACEQPW